LPAAQLEHVVMFAAPIAAEKVPPGQGVHEAEPAAAAKVPAAQGAQVAFVAWPVTPEAVPAGQARGAVALAGQK